ncbi:MAG: FecR domain-containing protein [Gammaproteobacteria bacterium]|nr:FecR domain-containing protein [Gammaproteobacteria bacterium]
MSAAMQVKQCRAAALFFGLVFAVLMVTSAPGYAQDANSNLKVVGEIALTKGVVTARSAQRALTAVAKGSPVYLGDIIETASRSFTVIKFSDGGKVTLRPDSRFDINEYDDTAGQEKESFELIKGGLRAVTGAIGKARPQEVKYTARNTTIGIRGTTFVVRLCEEGSEGCNYVSDGSDTAIGETDNKFVDIFVIDKDGGQRKRITRRQLAALLEGVYVSVIDGAIRVSTDEWFIDMQAGDKCVIDYSDVTATNRESLDEVECFINSRGLEDIDVFLGEGAEKITGFNLFDDSEIFVGNEICEIN